MKIPQVVIPRPFIKGVTAEYRVVAEYELREQCEEGEMALCIETAWGKLYATLVVNNNLPDSNSYLYGWIRRVIKEKVRSPRRVAQGIGVGLVGFFLVWSERQYPGVLFEENNFMGPAMEEDFYDLSERIIPQVVKQVGRELGERGILAEADLLGRLRYLGSHPKLDARERKEIERPLLKHKVVLEMRKHILLYPEKGRG